MWHLPTRARSSSLFHRRLVLSVLSLFLLTMFLFIGASFVSERNLHYRETYEHLDETLGILFAVLHDLNDRNELSAEALHGLEQQLEQRTAVDHRIFLTDSDFTIIMSSNADLVGRSLSVEYSLKPYGSLESPWVTASAEDMRWLASSLEPEKNVSRHKVFLMRSGVNIDRFIRRFLGLHGLHILATIVLFVLVLELIGARLVRRPMEKLADLIQDVERGKLGSESGSKRDDELAWFARRFTSMGKSLTEMIERLVRAEKYASVSVLVFRIAREMRGPLDSLNRHILYLEGLAENDEALDKVVVDLRRDRQAVVEVMARLNEIEPPNEETQPLDQVDRPSADKAERLL